MKGVKHYKTDGTEYKGSSHKRAATAKGKQFASHGLHKGRTRA